MPYKAIYDRLKAERPDEWRRRNQLDQERQKRKLNACFAERHPERAGLQNCRHCQSEFIPRRRGGNLQCYCSRRCKEHADNKIRRVRHPNRVKDGLRKLAAKRRAAWRAYMATQKCAHCSENHPATLDHHHLDPAEKAFNIAAWSQYRFEVVLAETAKCIVLCANCHRKIEWERKQERRHVRNNVQLSQQETRDATAATAA